MVSIRFKHGAAMALLILAFFLLLGGITEVVAGATGDRFLASVLAVVLGAAGLVWSVWYLATTMEEAELPDKTKEQMRREGLSGAERQPPPADAEE